MLDQGEHNGPRPLSAQQCATQCPGLPVFFFFFADWRLAAQLGRIWPTRSLLPRAQAATWAWAGKLRPRLGHIWPKQILAVDFDPTALLRFRVNKNPSQLTTPKTLAHSAPAPSLSAHWTVGSRRRHPQPLLCFFSLASSSPARAALSSSRAAAAAGVHSAAGGKNGAAPSPLAGVRARPVRSASPSSGFVRGALLGRSRRAARWRGVPGRVSLFVPRRR